MAESRIISPWRPCITVGIVVIVVIWICWWLWWRCPQPCPPAQEHTHAELTELAKCDCRHHTDVYFVKAEATSCKLVDFSGNTPTFIDTDPGDAVVWTNETDSPISIDFSNTVAYPNGSPFGRDKFVIPARGQWVTVVLDDAAQLQYGYDIDCSGGGGGVSGPKVNVGGG